MLVHNLKPGLRRPPSSVSLAILSLHLLLLAVERMALRLSLGNNLAVRFIDHPDAVHERNLRHPVAILGFDVTFPEILRLVHMRIRIDHFEPFPHGYALLIKKRCGYNI